MEGYTPDTPGTSKEKSSADKDKKVSKESAGSVIGKSFESANKEDAAGKLKDMPIWEKLIPKSSEAKPEKPADDMVDRPKSAESAAETSEGAPDVSLEVLSQEERAEVVRDYAVQKQTELPAEPSTEQDSAETAADTASREFYDKLAENPQSLPELVAELPPDPEADEQDGGEDDTAEISPERIETAEQADVEAPPAEDAELTTPEELQHDTAIDLAAERAAAEAVEDDDDDTVNQTSQPANGGSTPPPVPVPNRGGNQPPNLPVNPNAPNTPLPGANNPNINQSGSSSSLNPNTAPVTIENNYYDNVGSALLAGAILGYMLGRRRGRIKTERKLNAVSKKLERQIKQTRERIDQQEQVIRQQAREEYNQIHGPQPRGAETTAARTEQAKRSPAEVSGGARPEDIRTMKQPDLLALAEKIDVDGTSLRTIYEARQITEPGLRRIAGEFLRGGDLKKAVQQERQVKEMQYERDPQMRDRLAASYAEIDAARPESAQQALEKLLAQDSAPSSAQVRHAAQQAAADDAKAAQKPHNQVLISAWVALVIVLVIIVVVLAAR